MSFLFVKSISIDLLSNQYTHNRKRNRRFSHNCEIEIGGGRRWTMAQNWNRFRSTFTLPSRNNWLVLSFLCIFLSLSLSFRVILSGQGRVRDTFSRERQIIEGLWYTGEKESLIHAWGNEGSPAPKRGSRVDNRTLRSKAGVEWRIKVILFIQIYQVLEFLVLRGIIVVEEGFEIYLMMSNARRLGGWYGFGWENLRDYSLEWWKRMFWIIIK